MICPAHVVIDCDYWTQGDGMSWESVSERLCCDKVKRVSIRTHVGPEGTVVFFTLFAFCEYDGGHVVVCQVLFLGSTATLGVHLKERTIDRYSLVSINSLCELSFFDRREFAFLVHKVLGLDEFGEFACVEPFGRE